MTDKSYSISLELLKIILQPGYIYFKCTDGEVYQAEIKTPEPGKGFILPPFKPAEEGET